MKMRFNEFDHAKKSSLKNRQMSWREESSIDLNVSLLFDKLRAKQHLLSHKSQRDHIEFARCHPRHCFFTTEFICF